MRRIGPVTALWLAALAGTPSAALADKVTITFEGTIFAVNPLLVPPLSGSDDASGSVKYDLETPDATPGTEFGTYFGSPFDYTLTVGPYTVTAEGEPTDVARVSRSGDVDSFQITMEEPVGAEIVAGFVPTTVTFGLEDTDATALPTTALPTALDLGEFENRIASINFTDGASFAGVSVRITAMEVTVPEPGAPLLLATGALVLAAASRRARPRPRRAGAARPARARRSA